MWYPVNKHGSHSSRTDSPQSFSLLGLLCIALDSVNDPPPPKKPQNININKKQKNKSTQLLTENSGRFMALPWLQLHAAMESLKRVPNPASLIFFYLSHNSLAHYIFRLQFFFSLFIFRFNFRLFILHYVGTTFGITIRKHTDKGR